LRFKEPCLLGGQGRKFKGFAGFGKGRNSINWTDFQRFTRAFCR